MKSKNEIFATALDWLVKNKGIDGQKGLAEATGISANTISRIMTGKVQPSDTTLRIMADKFDFNMEWLRGHEGQPMFNTDSVNTNHHEWANTHKSTPVDADFSHDALDLYSKVIESMRKDIEYYQQMILDQDSLIQDHNEMIVSLKSDNAKLATQLEHTKTTLDAVRKNFDVQAEEMAKREQMIESLKIALDRASERYHHPMGVADESPRYNHLTTDSEK